MVKTGDADIAFMLPQGAVEDYKGDKAYTFLSKDQSGTGLQMVMNIRKPPLSDIRVRKALLFGSDENLVNDIVYDGNYAKAEGPLSKQPSLSLGRGGADVPARCQEGGRLAG